MSLFPSTDISSHTLLFVLSGAVSTSEARQTIEDALRKDGLKRSEIAILYRSNAQSRVLEEALLREKIVAAASARMIVIADASKQVEALGRFPLPIEVNTFGFGATARAIARVLEEAGCPAPLTQRKKADGHVFVTDGGHMILDAACGRIPDPAALAARLHAVPGVVEHGLFIGLASFAIIASPGGAEVVGRVNH